MAVTSRRILSDGGELVMTSSRRSVVLDEPGGPGIPHVRHLEERHRDPAWRLLHELRVEAGSLTRGLSADSYELQENRMCWRCVRDIDAARLKYIVRAFERDNAPWTMPWPPRADVFEALHALYTGAAS